MLAEAAPAVPPSVQVPVPVCSVAIPFGGFGAVWQGARQAGDRHPVRLGLVVMAGLAAWGALVVGLARLGVPWGDVDAWPPWRLVGFVVPGLAGWYGVRRWPRLRAALSTRQGLAQLAAIEIARNLGAVFFILHRRGDLAGLFAFPAAWGDILVGMTAPPAVAAATARRVPRAEVVRHPVGHFDVYAGEPLERVVADEVAFLRRHLAQDGSGP